MSVKKIKTVIKGKKVKVDLVGFEGKKCVKEREKFMALLGLLGINNRVTSKSNKNEVLDYVNQRTTGKISQR